MLTRPCVVGSRESRHKYDNVLPLTWTQYYAQQGGYDAGADASSYGQAASSSSYGAGSSSAAASQVQYDANGYRIHAGGTSTGGAGAPQLLDAELLQQSSVYVPGAEVPKTTGKAKTQVPVGRRDTVIRKAGGRVWEDATLVEWDPSESCRNDGEKECWWLRRR